MIFGDGVGSFLCGTQRLRNWNKDGANAFLSAGTCARNEDHVCRLCWDWETQTLVKCCDRKAVPSPAWRVMKGAPPSATSPHLKGRSRNRGGSKGGAFEEAGVQGGLWGGKGDLGGLRGFQGGFKGGSRKASRRVSRAASRGSFKG